MRVVNRQDYTLDVKIKDISSPSNMKSIHFIRSEFNTDENIILTNTYEFFLTKDDIKKLAKVFNDYE
jgi:hypothetical protein